MRVKIPLVSLAAAVSLCVIASGAAGYLYAVRSTEPQLTAVTVTACGVPASTSGFTIPMQLLATAVPPLPVTIGPFTIPGIEGGVSLQFDPTIDGRSAELPQIEGVIRLPLIFGRAAAHPSRITLICRDGHVATVHYRLGTRERATFRVIDMAPGSGPRERR